MTALSAPLHEGPLHKIAIIGAGSVGAAIAYASLVRGVADELVLLDVNAAKAEAEVLDLRHGLQFVPHATVQGGDEVELCDGADVIVFTAGAKQHPGQSRLDLATSNAALCRSALPVLRAHAPSAIVLMVTNPVDVVTMVAQDVLDDRTGRVFGSGTVLDTSRLRVLLAERLGISVASVHAAIAGEHGDTSFALWSTASVGGMPLSEVPTPSGAPLTGGMMAELMEEVRRAAYRVIAGKGATNLAIGLATTRILEAIRNDERAVLPVSWRHQVEPVGPVCLSLPAIVGRNGVERVLHVPMSSVEQEALRVSAAAIAAAWRHLDGSEGGVGVDSA
jgi:L-lactate dehydrogenase